MGLVIRHIFAAILAPLTTASSVMASTQDLESAIHQLIPFDQGPYVPRDVREAYVDALRSYWQSFSDRVPRLSPAEIDWLTTEYNTHDTERANRALNSEEAALHSIALHIDACLEGLANIDEALGAAQAQQLEMYHWLDMVSCYNELPETIRRLHRAGLSDGRFDGSFYAVGHLLIFEVIVDKVIPSAMADTMGWTLEAN